MTRSLSYTEIERWFTDYFRHFTPMNDDDAEALSIKWDHSFRVMEYMTQIATGLHLLPETLEKAKIIGLLHDVARFWQYTTFHTMNDHNSVDHGFKGDEIIRQESPLASLPIAQQDEIALPVRYHNQLVLPPELPSSIDQLARMIRDADKLDVFRLVCPVYTNDPEHSGERLKMHLPSTGPISHHIIQNFLSQHPIKFSDLHNMEEFKILQLAWVFDFNFTVSLQLLYNAHYLDQILDSLPEFPEKAQFTSVIRMYFIQQNVQV